MGAKHTQRRPSLYIAPGGANRPPLHAESRCPPRSLSLNPLLIGSQGRTKCSARLRTTDFVLIPFLSGLRVEPSQQALGRFVRVLIPFLSGLRVERLSPTSGADSEVLIPFLSGLRVERAQTCNATAPRVLIPFLSGLRVERLSCVVVVWDRSVLIPFLSGLRVELSITATISWMDHVLIPFLSGLGSNPVPNATPNSWRGLNPLLIGSQGRTMPGAKIITRTGS